MAIHLDPRTTPDTPDAPDTDVNVKTRRTREPAVHGRAYPLPRLRRSHRPWLLLRRAPLPGVSRPNIALAGLELLIGYEWLVSGVDKLLLGTFPAMMTGLLNGSLSGGRLPDFFAALLRGLVLPNAQLFGYFIEWSETLAGVALMAVGLVTLLRPLAERYLKLRAALVFSYGARLLDVVAPFAAAGAGLLGLSFFLLDGLPTAWFAPSTAYGGAIDTGFFLAIASVILVVSRLRQRQPAKA
jgi:hypothetical protein